MTAISTTAELLSEAEELTKIADVAVQKLPADMGMELLKVEAATLYDQCKSAVQSTNLLNAITEFEAEGKVKPLQEAWAACYEIEDEKTESKLANLVFVMLERLEHMVVPLSGEDAEMSEQSQKLEETKNLAAFCKEVDEVPIHPLDTFGLKPKRQRAGTAENVFTAFFLSA